jgi:hypothetical protein
MPRTKQRTGSNGRADECQPLTLGSLSKPVATIHALADIPIAGPHERWGLLDWEALRKAVREGGAVSFDVEPGDLSLVRSFVTTELSGDVYHDELTHDLEMRYDSRTHRLWAWGASHSPWQSAEPSDIVA